MYNKNKGRTKKEVLQNQFTAYLKKAVHNRRIRYLSNEHCRQGREAYRVDEIYFAEDVDFMQEFADYETIRQVLRSIKGKERHIVLARIIDEKPFNEIAKELNMSYKAVTSLYCRILKQLKKYINDGGDR